MSAQRTYDDLRSQMLDSDNYADVVDPNYSMQINALLSLSNPKRSLAYYHDKIDIKNNQPYELDREADIVRLTHITGDNINIKNMLSNYFVRDVANIIGEYLPKYYVSILACDVPVIDKLHVYGDRLNIFIHMVSLQYQPIKIVIDGYGTEYTLHVDKAMIRNSMRQVLMGCSYVDKSLNIIYSGGRMCIMG